MKLLLVNGSPHKGNTWKLTQRVKEMLAVYDSAIEFQEVHLIELNLPFCTGCSNCFRNGHRFCPHHEIVQPVMDMIERSDGVVFSVSCFQGHLTGVMKNFTDHMAFMLHRPRYLGMQYAPGIPIPIYKRFFGILIYMIGKHLSKTTVITYRK